MRSATPIFKHLVLVGGGHAHALLIKMWAMQPLPGVRVTLISPQWQTPYSGMLPGLLAGHYQSDDIHIDLRRLSHWAGIRFIEDKVIGLDKDAKSLRLQNHPKIEYDLLSLDIGSTPDTSLPGLTQHAKAIKPVDSFYPRYQALLQRCRAASEQTPLRVAVVGGGAGGVEVILALAEALKDDRPKVKLNLLIRDQQTLTSYPKKAALAATKALKKSGIKLHNNFEVMEVKAQQLLAKNGTQLDVDEMFFCTQARAADWLEEAGLDCDSRGFVRVNSFLQSLSASDIFAAGDIAAMVESPRPKAGVYAVRQGPYLFENLKHHLKGEALKPYQPQDNFLSLLSLGGKKALAAKQSRSLSAHFLQPLLWRWKNHIDRKFITMVNDLPTLSMSNANGETVDPVLITEQERSEIINPELRCTGCGGKVGTDILQQVLMDVTGVKDFMPEDAAEIEINTEDKSATIIQTVDQISSPIDDPYHFGQLSALHALSDIFAMNAKPISAQVLLNLPYAGARIQLLEMKTLMRGLLSVLDAHSCKLIGGHTSEAKELSIGMVVNALPKTSHTLFRKNSLKPGDTLVLTKAIGTGVILAAHMQNEARGEWYNAAMTSMLESNKRAAELFSGLGVVACTDVTGFGLVGHLCEMLQASNCSATISLTDIPLIQGALSLSRKGFRSSLYSQNLSGIKSLSIEQSITELDVFPLLFDPQTSGGLLAGVDDNALQQLQAQSDVAIFVIGHVEASETGQSWGLKLLK